MEPVWETNNVWLIFVLVIMWTGFPILFQTVFSAMWLPLALAAVGLVLRGAGFALRKPTRSLARRRVYGAVFAVASLLTPFFLGAAVGGLATGRVAPGTKASADAWSNGTSILAGLLTIAATAFLGAVFLTADRDTAWERVSRRPGHIMPAGLVDSQFATLEPLEPDEPGMTLDATADLPARLTRVRAAVARFGGPTGG